MIYALVGGLVLLGAFLWFARKAGKDSVKAKVAEKAVEKVVEANRPITADDIASVRKYRRD